VLGVTGGFEATSMFISDNAEREQYACILCEMSLPVGRQGATMGFRKLRTIDQESLLKSPVFTHYHFKFLGGYFNGCGEFGHDSAEHGKGQATRL
jgi:hypothetical protein